MGQLVNFCAGTNMHILPAKHVDAILVNVPDNGCSETSINGTKRMFAAARAKHTMLDSGGFQLLMGERDSKAISIDENRQVICTSSQINIAPAHVMKAAAGLKPDIVIGLDFPIDKISDPNEQKIEFMRKLGFNVLWARECSNLRRRLCPDVGYFVPVQCYDLFQFDQFISLIDGIEFEGFSMPVRNMTDAEIILFLVRFYQMGIRQVHLLGTSNLFAAAIAAFMARHFFDWVSFDATTWSEFGKAFTYMNPNHFKPERINSAFQMVCDCPFCRGRTPSFIRNLPDTELGSFLKCHNWGVIEKATRDLFQNATNTIDLSRCLYARGANSAGIEKLIRTLSLAHALKDGNIGLLQDQLKQ